MLMQVTGTTGVGREGVKPSGRPGLSSNRRAATPPVYVPPLTGAPQAEITALVRSVISASIIDRSGSMFGSGGDPSDVCGAAAESLVELQRRSGGGRSVVVPWGSTAPPELVTGPLDVVKGRRGLRTALREFGSLGGTDMASGLRRTHEVVMPLRPDETFVGFVFSDGIDDGGSVVRDAVAAFPAGSVHLLLIDRFGWTTPASHAAWSALPFGSVTVLDHLDVVEMANQLVAVFAAAIGLTAVPATPRRLR